MFHIKALKLNSKVCVCAPPPADTHQRADLTLVSHILRSSQPVLADVHHLHTFAKCAGAPCGRAFKGSRRLSVSQPPEKDSII